MQDILGVVMVHPAAGHPTTARFKQRGTHWSACGWHTGIDIGCPDGTPVKACTPGTLRARNYGASFGTQVAVSGDPGDPFGSGEVFYAHLSRINTAVLNTRVSAGDVIAWSGHTGAGTGPHLHVELHTVKNAWSCGVMLDPQQAFDWQPPTGPYVTQHIYSSKLGYGQQDSDTVKELQERLNRTKLTGGQTLPITGTYGAMTDQEVRLWQKQVRGDTPDPPLASYLGPRQRAVMFPAPPYTIHDDGSPVVPPKDPEPPAGVMHGIDISSHQAGISLSKIPAEFVIIKATEGKSYLSPDVAAQYGAARAADRLVGLYHFARPDNGNTAAEEAEWFAAAYLTVLDAAGDTVLVLDWEREPLADTAWVTGFVDRLIALTGVTPLIYMSESVTRRADWAAVGARCPLWVAKYSKTPPDVTWPGGWAVWQWTSGWRAPAWAGPLDHNVSRVGADTWRRWARPVDPPDPPDPPDLPVSRAEFDALAADVRTLGEAVGRIPVALRLAADHAGG